MVAKDVETAFEIAANKMDLDITQLEYEILQEGKKGFLGIGRLPYKFLFYRSKSLETEERKPLSTPKQEDNFDMNTASLNRIDGWVEDYVTKDGKFICVHPPKKNGRKASHEEVVQALKRIHAEDIDDVRIKGFVKKSNGKPIWAGEWVPDVLRDARVEIEASNGKMKVFARYIAPLSGGCILEKEDVLKVLKEQHIIYGVKESNIQELIDKRHYNVPYFIAEGKPMVPGKDATLKTKVDLDKMSHYLEYDDKDKIDFRDISSLVSVMKDQGLIEKENALPGEDGVNVYGELIPCQEGKDTTITGGKNTYVTEDGMQLKSSLNGHVVTIGGVLHVQEVYVVRGDVGPVTGHVTSLNSVVVMGSVLSGYNVKSGGSIEIRKDVGNCDIEAAGNINIRMGVNGNNNAKIVSQKGSVYVRYLQDCIVKAKGDVVVRESILNSRVNADECVLLNGKKCAIMGGTTRALRKIICKTLGSSSGLQTRVEVGVLPEVRAALANYTHRMSAFEDKVEDIHRQIATLNSGEMNDKKQTKIKETQERIQILKDINQQDIERSQKLKEFIKNSYETIQGEVVVTRRITSGVNMSCNAGFLEINREQGPARGIQDVDNPEYVKLEVLTTKQIRSYHHVAQTD